jgi:hypothetical protein
LEIAISVFFYLVPELFISEQSLVWSSFKVLVTSYTFLVVYSYNKSELV